jgi:hypothetical protein
MSETGAPPELIQRLIAWAEEKTPELSAAGVSLSHRHDSSDSTWAAWIEGESSQRLGSLTLWESGELDMQVLRRADDLLVLNEHRLIREPDDLLNALEAFRLALVYHDVREE